jgi:dCMP deaminase
VGALIVNDFHVTMPGYNGTPEHGQPGCLEGACPRGLKSLDEVPAYAPYTDCIAVHAEANALKKARRVMMDLQGAVAYVTREPCNSCHKLLADAGLAGAYWCQDEMWEPGGSPGHISYYEPEDLRKIYQN